MIVAISKIQVTNGNAQALADQYAKRTGLVDEMPGFVSVEVLRNCGNPDEFLVYMRWENREAFQAYKTSPAFREAHRNVAHIPGGVKIDRKTRELSIYETVTS